jgi:hypothetical protein
VKFSNRSLLPIILVGCFLFENLPLEAQVIRHIRGDKYDLVHFGNRSDYLLPHVAGTFRNAMAFHREFWNYHDTMTYVILNDFEDLGHGGAIAMPYSQVQLGIEPYSFAFSIIPSSERFQWLFNHELTHIVQSDKANSTDAFFRNVFGGKVRRTEEKPLSALWSLLTTPRWYAPRWFHEGIACFMETWMSGGIGRSMGSYDEMYFRSIVNEKQPLYSLVGLETEGTTIDFQVGTNAYLYGTRFITYLAYRDGIDKLKAFYSRSDSSKAFFGAQFKRVYGQSVKNAWDDWRQHEATFQKQNIERLKEYPVTPFRPLTREPLGNVSNFAWNASTGKLYMAINHPGIISQIAEIDKNTGKIRKIATLDSPLMYYSTSLAYDPKREKIYITEHNNKYRNLVEVDVRTGRKTVLNPMTRTGNLVFNPADHSIWGVQHDNGYAKLVRIPEPYTQVVPMYTAPFGKAIFDLAVSHAGDKLTASLSGVKGEQSLILFHLSELEQGYKNFDTLCSLEDNTLTQFQFSDNDSTLIGSSYYNGVSNIWSIGLTDRSPQMLSNTETGLFMPLQLSEDSLFVLKFFRDGLQPGIIPVKKVNDANSIIYFGNMVYEKHPEVGEWSLPPASSLKADSVSDEPYYPLKQMHLANAWPDIAGFKGTVAAGYRLEWKDIMGLSDLEVFVAASPWSQYADRQKFHITLDWKYWDWHFSASYNKPHFYDLFGPSMRSRAGYSLGVDYLRERSMNLPLKTHWGFGVHTYGDLEVLPQYQNVSTSVSSLQAANVTYGKSKVRRTLGAVQDEMGYTWDITMSSYLVNGNFYPSLVSNQDFGFLIPASRNTCFWIRNSIGQSFGSRQSIFSNFYFGGFRNNYIDWQPSEQYRSAVAFPGAEIDEIPAYNYVKTMGELDLRPLRLRNVGTAWLYPTYIKSSLFGTHLMTGFDSNAFRRNYFNLGGQVDVQLVLFSYLKTTWSIGYARKFESGQPDVGRWMLSLRLLGD